MSQKILGLWGNKLDMLREAFRARFVTVDARFTTARAVAVADGKIIAIGADDAALKHRGPRTRVIDAGGKTVLPGLYDSHVHPVGVVTTELADPPPVLRSLKEAFAFIRERAADLPEGRWIVLRYTFPTRLDEGRFPTRAELDAAIEPAGPTLVSFAMGKRRPKAC